MSILNRPSDGLLSVLLALYRALLAYGSQTELQLLQVCAPSTVVPDGKPDMARKTLTRWKQLGFFVEVDGLVHLSPEIAEIDVDDLNSFRAAVLRMVLLPSNNPALSTDPDEDVENNRASDCTRAMAWALAQDPYSFQILVGHRAVEAQENAQGVNPPLFKNDTRWPGFKEWATFLGIAWPTSKGIVPDPAFAIRAVLPEVFSGVTELPQDVFLQRLVDMLPILDGGTYRRMVDDQIARPWRRGIENQLSASLSLGLLTLEAREEIRLEARSDAPQKILLGRGGRELRPMSHLVRLETK